MRRSVKISGTNRRKRGNRMNASRKRVGRRGVRRDSGTGDWIPAIVHVAEEVRWLLLLRQLLVQSSGFKLMLHVRRLLRLMT
jgi:hypothetical protein